VKWTSKAQSALLLTVGLVMLGLSLSGKYPYFFNPAYRLCTAFGGVGISAAAVVSFLHPLRTGPLRLSAYTLFTGLLIFAVMSVRTVGTDIEAGHGELAGMKEGDTEPSRVSCESEEYVPINTAELLFLCENGDPFSVADHFVVRGEVRRTEELDAEGRFLIMRTTVFCCLADAVGVGFRVESPDYATLRDGEWVQLFGRLERTADGGHAGVSLYEPGMFSRIVEMTHILRARRIVDISTPDPPYAFIVKSREPFVY
jgi:hypothetical protein